MRAENLEERVSFLKSLIGSRLEHFPGENKVIEMKLSVSMPSEMLVSVCLQKCATVYVCLISKEEGFLALWFNHGVIFMWGEKR